MTSLSDRFLKFVSPEALTGCWLWTGSLKGKGYGGFRLRTKMVLAHRLSYALFNDHPPDGFLVCHYCNTPACVNPNHLYLGTYSDNTKQAVQQGRQFNPSGEQNGSAKLTKEQVIKILYDKRVQRLIAKEYKISQLHVSRIKRKKVWKNV